MIPTCSVEVDMVGEINGQFSPHEVPPFATRVFRVVWTWRHLAAEAVTFKIIEGAGGWGDSELHNKPPGCGAAEAYASGPGSEKEEPSNTITFCIEMNTSTAF
jgi:hypothetical protein